MDEQIIRQVLNGDIEQFRHLISRYKNRSFSLARSIAGSDLTAEEAVQDAFIKAFQNLHKFRGKAKFSTWLYRIVYNESLRKARDKHALVTGFEEEIKVDQEPAVEPDAIASLHAEEQKEIINGILDSLRPAESLLLRLYYLEEKSIEEIEQITGLSHSNSKVLLHRARKHFAQVYTVKIKEKIY